MADLSRAFFAAAQRGAISRWRRRRAALPLVETRHHPELDPAAAAAAFPHRSPPAV